MAVSATMSPQTDAVHAEPGILHANKMVSPVMAGSTRLLHMSFNKETETAPQTVEEWPHGLG